MVEQIVGVFGMQGAILVTLVTYIIFDQKGHVGHERRLTRMETKFDLILKKNGINPDSKGGKNGI